MATANTSSSSFDRETDANRTSCSECGGALITENRETRCRECGLIVDEYQIDHGPEWFITSENTNRRRTGAPLTGGRHDRGLSAEIGRHTDGHGNVLPGRKQRQLNRLRREHRRARWRSKCERNLAHGLGEVRRLVSALELTDSICEQACMLFRRAHDRDLCPGRSIEGIAAASVYAVCRCNGLGRTIDEISQYGQCSRAQVECSYAAMNTELELPAAVPRPQTVLPRLTTELAVPDAVQHRALTLASVAEEAEITIGCHPHGFAAACLYRAGQELGHWLTQQELADVAGTSPTTIRAHRDRLLDLLDDQK